MGWVEILQLHARLQGSRFGLHWQAMTWLDVIGLGKSR
jgi:hypothetical protein